MCSRLVVVLLTVAGAFPLMADEPVRPQDKPIVLFDGKSLDGFYIWTKGHGTGDPRQVFSVRDGLLHVTGEGLGGLITNKEYADYHLICDFRWGERTWPPRDKKTRDTGVLVHCTGPDGGYSDTWHASIEAQIIEGGVGDILVVPGKNADGTSVPLSADAEIILDRDGEKVWTPGGEARTFKSGRINWIGRDDDWKDELGFRGDRDVESEGKGWTRLEVVCKGDEVTNIVNGVVVNHVFNVTPTAGKITLQTEYAEYEVRRLELWPLGKAPRFEPADLSDGK
jgi:hypothetical protein